MARQKTITMPLNMLYGVASLEDNQLRLFIRAIVAYETGMKTPYMAEDTRLLFDEYVSGRLEISDKRRAAVRKRWDAAPVEEQAPAGELPTEVDIVDSEPIPEVIEEPSAPELVLVPDEAPKPKPKPRANPYFTPNNSFLSESPIRDQFLSWIDYKRARRETYKTQLSYEACHKKLMKLSGGNPAIAQEIIESSISNNYMGLFPLKSNNNGTDRYTQRLESERKLAEDIARNCADKFASENRKPETGSFVPPSL